MTATHRTSTRPSPTLLLLSVLASSGGFLACSVGSGGTSGFTVRRTSVSVAPTTPVAISGKNLAFLADEATTGPGGTIMNADGDTVDSIAVVVDMQTRDETNLGIAATALAWIGDELYLVVDEALDGRDWEVPADPVDKLVLLHWSAAAGAPTFVDRVASTGSTKVVAVGTNLFYASARAPAGAGDSSLEVIASSAPLVHTSVQTQEAVPLSPRILGKDEGLLFLLLDETVEGSDLNADTDTTDTAVLALLDGTLTAAMIRNTELATPAGGTPFRADQTASHDWSVGFLVSEADQDATNFNCPTCPGLSASWLPQQCIGEEDVDATDNVLHYIEFAAWDANPTTDPPVNTGLVGSRRIAIANGYIATITPEVDAPDTSAEGICDLNEDLDKLDHVVRWVEMATPILPLTRGENIHALAVPPGGTAGLAELDNRFVIAISESEDDRDLNGDALKTFELLAWLSPSGATNSDTPWNLLHGCPNNDCNLVPQTFVGATWMAEQPDRSRLNVALDEKIEGLNINSHVPPVAGEDTDTLDSVPTFGDVRGNPVRISFPGVAIAVEEDNAGIVLARNYAFYRVDEAADSRNWNAPGDGDETDFVLFRTSLAQTISQSMGALNSIPGRPAIDVNLDETPFGAAFIADEQLQGSTGTDFNVDGDRNDLVLSFFKF